VRHKGGAGSVSTSVEQEKRGSDVQEGDTGRRKGTWGQLKGGKDKKKDVGGDGARK